MTKSPCPQEKEKTIKMMKEIVLGKDYLEGIAEGRKQALEEVRKIIVNRMDKLRGEGGFPIYEELKELKAELSKLEKLDEVKDD